MVLMFNKDTQAQKNM